MAPLSDEQIRAEYTPAEIVAMTAFGEARGDGRTGMHAVVNVIMNRASRPRWWGFDPVSCCLKSSKRGVHQFSCWNANDPNRARMLEEVRGQDPRYAVAFALAQTALAGRLPDVTEGADHYYATSMPKPPYWARGRDALKTIRNHIFFRLEK